MTVNTFINPKSYLIFQDGKDMYSRELWNPNDLVKLFTFKIIASNPCSVKLSLFTWVSHFHQCLLFLCTYFLVIFVAFYYK